MMITLVYAGITNVTVFIFIISMHLANFAANTVFILTSVYVYLLWINSKITSDVFNIPGSVSAAKVPL
jgi:hypothetical protein